MIKAAGMADGKPLLILGLSAENMTRLVAGEPIQLDTELLGLPPMRVWIIGGKTEDDIRAELVAHGLIPPPHTRGAAS